jgi:hypothetical protein
MVILHRRPRFCKILALRAVLVMVALASVVLQSTKAEADNHLVQIDEVMAGANGDPNIQFIEMRMCCSGQNRWGPQLGESVGRAMLVFFDASGAQTGLFVFPSNPPISGLNASVLIATQAFAGLSTTPTPDFVINPLINPGSGKVCFKSNPANNVFPVNLCLSYGSFTGDTESAGNPAPALPITGASSLKRFQNLNAFGFQANADFSLGTPAPTNGAGQTGTVPLAPTQLGFIVQPSNSAVGAAISPALQVEVRDANGNRVTTSTNSITIGIGANPGGGTLSGTTTVSAVNGVATFSNLSIDKTGVGYTLAASATGLTGAASAAFDVAVGCALPASGAWMVTQSCILISSAIAPANVIVEQNVTLTIDANAALNIDFSSSHLRIRSGAKVVIEAGGKIH